MIPKVYAKLSNENVIVMEYIASKSVLEYQGNKKQLAYDLMDSFISQLIETGDIHGEPHVGNRGVNGDRIVLYDFGNVLHIPYEDRQRLKILLYQLLINNKAGIKKSLGELNIIVEDDDSLSGIIDMYINYMKTVDIKALSDMHDPWKPLPIRFGDKIVRIMRVYGILEGICKELYPPFNYFDLFDRYVDKLFFDEELLSFKAQEDIKYLYESMTSLSTTPSITSSSVNKNTDDKLDKMNNMVMALYVVSVLQFMGQIFYHH